MFNCLQGALTQAQTAYSEASFHLVSAYPAFFRNTLVDDVIFLIMVLTVIGFWLYGVLVNPHES